MGLSEDLISQFVKVTNDKNEKNKESISNGTVVEYNGEKYVRLDGSDLLTPVSSTADIDDSDRVMVSVKNHTATVVGNTSSPSAKSSTVERIGKQISDFEIIVANKVDTEELNAQTARIDNLVSDNVNIKKTLTANAADITDLKSDNVTINDALTANTADITDLKSENATITGKLNATNADIGSLQADNVVIRNELDAVSARIDSITATDITTDYLDANYIKSNMANIDFANLNKANIGQLFADVGLISSATITDGHVTGYLDSVEVNANKITAGTLAVDRLLIKDSEGNYKLASYDESGNIVTTTVDGSVITERTITADHLVAGTITANEINMTNLVGNSAFVNAISTNSIVVGASTAASDALSAIDDWRTPNTTTINGGKITTGSIKAAQIAAKSITSNEIASGTIKASNIDVTDLFAQNITASGTISGLTLNGTTIEVKDTLRFWISEYNKYFDGIKTQYGYTSGEAVGGSLSLCEPYTGDILLKLFGGHNSEAEADETRISIFSNLMCENSNIYINGGKLYGTATNADNSDTVDGHHLNQDLLTYSSPTFSTVYTPNWFRSTGNSGWYSESYGGGWYMIDTTWIRAYNDKPIYSGGMINSGNIVQGSAGLKAGINGTVFGLICSSSVVSARGTSIVILSKATIDAWAGHDTLNRCAVFVSNGDGIAASQHVEGATYQNGNWYAVFNTGKSGAIRINWTVIWW